MCAYCMVGDHAFRYNPPWPADRDTFPQIPAPEAPFSPPWDLLQLKDFHDILKRVKALEDALGCPCEPNKADYLKLFADRIAKLEKRAAKKAANAKPHKKSARGPST